MAHAPARQRRVDIGWAGAFLDHEEGFGDVFFQHAVAGKAVAIANRDADLAQRPRGRHGGDERIGCRLLAAHDLDEPHHIGGEKKCMPSTSAGREVAAAILSISSVEVLEASSAPCRHTFVQFAEDLLLHGHILEGRLDDEIRAAKRAEIHRAVNKAEPLLHGRLADAPAPHHALVILCHHA